VLLGRKAQKREEHWDSEERSKEKEDLPRSSRKRAFVVVVVLSRSRKMQVNGRCNNNSILPYSSCPPLSLTFLPFFSVSQVNFFGNIATFVLFLVFLSHFFGTWLLIPNFLSP